MWWSCISDYKIISENTNNNNSSTPWRIVISHRRAARSLCRTATVNAELTRGAGCYRRLDVQRSGAIEAVASHGGAISQSICLQNIAPFPAVFAFGSIRNDSKRHVAAK
jgi:hypothetical protein